MSEARWPIPKHWAWGTIADIGEVHGGGTPPARQSANFSDDGGIPWVTPADMSGRTSAYIRRGRRNLSEVGLGKSSARILPPGTVIFSSRAPIGYCAVAANDITTSQGCKNVVLKPEHVPEYLMLYLRHSRAYAESLASGTTFLELSAAKMKTVAVPIPPPEEQAVIVVALDYLLGRIETIKGLLHSVPDLGNSETKRLLSEAYDGRLTETWRRRSAVETGVATHTVPKASTGSGTFAFEDVKVSELLSIPIQNGLSVRGQDTPPGVRALRLSALRSMRVDLDDVRYLPIPSARARRYELASGDILVSRGNGTKALVGRASLTEAPHELTIFPDTTFRLRTDPTRADPAWLALILNSPQVRRRIEYKARTTAGIWKIRQADVIDHKLPLPSIEEQREIVRILHGSLSRIDALTRIATQAIDNLERLRETLLSLAFRGELAKDALEGLSRTTLADLRLRALTAENDWAAPADPQQEEPVEMSRILKSRLDPDVRGKPYLASLLEASDEGSLSAKALFAITALPVADFYKQLMWELAHGHLVENGDEFRATP